VPVEKDTQQSGPRPRITDDEEVPAAPHQAIVSGH
jgi:hypothetical protein